jgi:outer membrane receptor for ferrienterochelin and colicins
MKQASGIIFIWLISTTFVLAQVSITIKAASGERLEGASLVVQSPTLSQTLLSNRDGKLEFRAEKFPVTVTGSYVGYATQSLVIASAGSYSMILAPLTSQLEEIVVTGQFEPQSVSRSVVKVKTISSETIRAKGATRLQDVLNTELNVRFSMDPALGVSTLSMQGLSGQNVKVLIDGIPVVGRQGTSNAIDLNQLNLNSIDRIEIIEGPMSTVYGADALAGVINIITRKPESEKVSGSIRIHEENIGNEYSFFKRGIHQQSASVGYRGKSFYTLVDFGRNYSGGWKGDSTGRERQWHPKTQWIGSGIVGFQRERWNISYRLDYLNENLYDPAHYSGNEAIDRNYITNRFMHQLQGVVTFNDKLTYNSAVAYTDYSRETQAVVVNKITGEETLALSGQERTEYSGVTIRGTLHCKLSDKLSLQPGYDINLESGSGGRLLAGANIISDYAGFLSAEIKPIKSITIRPGLRVVHNSVYQAPPVLPSLNVKAELSSRHDLRVSYGRGFRAPSIRELYFYFYDSNHQVEGNPDLEAELSHSVTASWNWRVLTQARVTYTTSIGGFFNAVDNMITNALQPGSAIYSYFNMDTYKTEGVTFNNNLSIGRLKVAAGFAYTGRYNQLRAEDRSLPEFTWSPEANASLSYAFEKAGLTANVFYKYTGKTPFYQQNFVTSPATVLQAETADYHWADVSVQKTLFKNLNAAAGVHNFFDVTRVSSTGTSDGGHGSSGNSLSSGRSFYTTLTLNF